MVRNVKRLFVKPFLLLVPVFVAGFCATLFGQSYVCRAGSGITQWVAPPIWLRGFLHHRGKDCPHNPKKESPHKKTVRPQHIRHHKRPFHAACVSDFASIAGTHPFSHRFTHGSSLPFDTTCPIVCNRAPPRA